LRGIDSVKVVSILIDYCVRVGSRLNSCLPLPPEFLNSRYELQFARRDLNWP